MVKELNRWFESLYKQKRREKTAADLKPFSCAGIFLKSSNTKKKERRKERAKKGCRVHRDWEVSEESRFFSIFPFTNQNVVIVSIVFSIIWSHACLVLYSYLTLLSSVSASSSDPNQQPLFYFTTTIIIIFISSTSFPLHKKTPSYWLTKEFVAYFQILNLLLDLGIVTK